MKEVFVDVPCAFGNGKASLHSCKVCPAFLKKHSIKTTVFIFWIFCCSGFLVGKAWALPGATAGDLNRPREHSEQGERTGAQEFVRQFMQAGCAGRALQASRRSKAQGSTLDLCHNGECSPQELKTLLLQGESPEISHAFAQMEPVRQEISVQVVDCTECQDPTPGEKISTCTQCAQVVDLLCRVAELQETVNRLCSIRGAEMEIGGFRTVLL